MPPVLSLWKLCEDQGKNYLWTSDQKPHLFNKDRKIDGKTANYAPFVVPGLSTSSSSSSSLTSPTSSSQEAVTPMEHPASTRSESMSEEVRGISSHDVSEWLGEFKDNLVDESVPEHRHASSFSHELPSESRAKWHRVSNAFLLSSRSTEIATSGWETNLQGLLAQDRTGTVVPRAESVGDLTTADR